MVSGQLVVRDSKAQELMVGKAIRFPVEEKGRFVPSDTEQWLQTFTIDGSLLSSN